MNWLTRWWQNKRPAPMPVLLRVVGSRGELPPEVQVVARWAPSQTTTQRTFQTANGLCMVHWRGEERSVELRVAAGPHAVTLTFTRDRDDAGRVREVRLSSTVVPVTAQSEPPRTALTVP